MLDYNMGTEQIIAGRTFIRTRPGATGHPVYGPYTIAARGKYSVDYLLALADATSAAEDVLCATIEVTTNWGHVVLASRELRSSELSPSPAPFQLTFTLSDVRVLEFRIAVTGSAELVVGAEPYITRLADVVNPEAAIEPGLPTNDPVELQKMVRSILRPLRPHGVAGFSKIRMGNISDGGYVLIDDFQGIDTAFSLGINDDITWDIDAAERGLTIYQFDHTVEDPAPDDPRMIFEKLMITTSSGPGTQSLPDLVRRHDKQLPRPNLMLKMDIELHEWEVIDDIDPALLGRFSQIVCELHFFQGLGQDGWGAPAAEWRRRIHAALTKLDRQYFVGHIHANTFGGASTIANVFVPHVLEVTYLNRSIYQPQPTDELFPGPLDASCDGNQPDIFLGSFRF